MSDRWRSAFSAPSTAVPWRVGLSGRTERLTFSARLPSTDEGLWFSAEFEMSLGVAAWARRRRQWAAGSARLAVIERARGITRDYSVADTGLAEAELERALLSEDIAADTEARTGCVTVRLTADAEDVELAKTRERCTPRYAIKAEEHRAQMQHLKRLTADVYSDPAVALRWWFDRNPGQTRDLDMAADRLRLVLADDYESTGGSPAVEAVGEFVSDLLRGLGGDDRDAVLGRLTLLFEGFGRRDLAKRLRAEQTEARDPSGHGGAEEGRRRDKAEVRTGGGTGGGGGAS